MLELLLLLGIGARIKGLADRPIELPFGTRLVLPITLLLLELVLPVGLGSVNRPNNWGLRPCTNMKSEPFLLDLGASVTGMENSGSELSESALGSMVGVGPASCGSSLLEEKKCPV